VWDREPTEQEAEPGFMNFSAVEVTLTRLDVLELEFTGHRRSIFTPTEATWALP
jgi:hypothetical protein